MNSFSGFCPLGPNCSFPLEKKKKKRICRHCQMPQGNKLSLVQGCFAGLFRSGIILESYSSGFLFCLLVSCVFVCVCHSLSSPLLSPLLTSSSLLSCPCLSWAFASCLSNMPLTPLYRLIVRPSSDYWSRASLQMGSWVGAIVLQDMPCIYGARLSPQISQSYFHTTLGFDF